MPCRNLLEREKDIVPIYEYRCHQCGKRVEVLLLSAEAEAVCPNCGGYLTEKLISVPFVLQPTKSAGVGGATCCGNEERCASPPCSDDGKCRR